jgi:hypothetical protein
VTGGGLAEQGGGGLAELKTTLDRLALYGKLVELDKAIPKIQKSWQSDKNEGSYWSFKS